MATQVAKLKDIYRCTGKHGEVAECNIGQTLPECTCSGGGTWEFLKTDNMNPDTATVVRISGDTPLVIRTDEPLRVKHVFNIRETEPGLGSPVGKYCVISLETSPTRYPKITVLRLGDIADDLPIHLSVRMTT